MHVCHVCSFHCFSDSTEGVSDSRVSIARNGRGITFAMGNFSLGRQSVSPNGSANAKELETKKNTDEEWTIQSEVIQTLHAHVRRHLEAVKVQVTQYIAKSK